MSMAAVTCFFFYSEPPRHRQLPLANLFLTDSQLVKLNQNLIKLSMLGVFWNPHDEQILKLLLGS